jgi:hypothetical protein
LVPLAKVGFYFGASSQIVADDGIDIGKRYARVLLG